MKIVFVTILYVIFWSGAFSQNNHFTLTLNPGGNINTLRGNDIIDLYHKPMVAFYFGTDAALDLGRGLHVVSGLAFQQNGSSIKSAALYDDMGNFTGSGRTRQNLNYISLPLMIEFSKGKNIRFQLQAGLFGSLLVSQFTKIKMEDNPMDLSDRKERQDLFKKWNGGLTAGAGITIPLSKNQFFSILIRDQLGLVNISSKPVMNSGSIKTNTLAFLIGIGKRF